jgi:tetratricopeptide (TPR) repeat protein
MELGTWTVGTLLLSASRQGDLRQDFHAILKPASDSADFFLVKSWEDQLQVDLWFRSCVRACETISQLHKRLQPLRVDRRVALCAGLASGEGRPDGFDPGPVAEKALLLANTAMEGQCLVSQQSYFLVRDENLQDIGFRDLGTILLEQEFRREPVYQLTAHDLPESFNSSFDSVSIVNNLPVLGYFVGRDEERDSLATALTLSRCVTLCGAPGIGKSHLANRVARSMLDSWAEGVIRVDLSRVETADGFWRSIKATFQTRSRELARVEADVSALLRNRSLLIILDGVDGCKSEVSAFLRNVLISPGPRVIVTCLTRLGTQTETSVRLRELILPPQGIGLTEEELQQYDSTALFVDRAKALRPTFEVGEEANLIGKICQAAHGNPWAIVQAAQALRTQSLHQIHEAVLASPRRSNSFSAAALVLGPGRLGEETRSLLNAVAWLRSPWTIEDATGLVDGNVPEVRPLLDSLIDAGLVVEVTDGPSAGRYRLEPDVAARLRRQQSKAVSNGFRERHRDHFTGLLIECYRGMRQADQGIYLDDLDSYHSDLIAAFDYLAETSKSPAPLADAISMTWPFWYKKNRAEEALKLLHRALRRFKNGDTFHRARLLLSAGILANKADMRQEAKKCYQMAERLGRPLNHDLLLGSIEGNLANLAWTDARVTEAVKLHRRSVERIRRVGHQVNLAKQLISFAGVLSHLGLAQEARANMAEARHLLEGREDAIDKWTLALGEGILGIHEGNLEGVRRELKEAADLDQDLRDPQSLARVLLWFARAECEDGRFDLAAEFLGAMRSMCGTHQVPLFLANELHVANIEGRIEKAFGPEFLKSHLLYGELTPYAELIDRSLTG